MAVRGPGVGGEGQNDPRQGGGTSEQRRSDTGPGERKWLVGLGLGLLQRAWSGRAAGGAEQGGVMAQTPSAAAPGCLGQAHFWRTPCRAARQPLEDGSSIRAAACVKSLAW